MAQSQIQEIVVQTPDKGQAEAVAREWVRRLELADGVRVTVSSPAAPTRPRRFVAYDGQAMSPQQYAAIALADAVEQVLQHEQRPLDTWALLQAGRGMGLLPGDSTLATLTRTLRLLAREGRVQAGAEQGTWQVRTAKKVAAA